MFYRVDFKKPRTGSEFGLAENYETFNSAAEGLYSRLEDGESLHRIFMQPSASERHARIVNERPLWSADAGWSWGRLTPAQQRLVRKLDRDHARAAEDDD